MNLSNVRARAALRGGSALTVLAVAGVMASPAFAQAAPSGQPVSTSPNNTTSQTPSSPELQTPAPGTGANGRVTTTDQKGEQAIVITGTVSRQTQTASPVTVVSASNLQDRGVTTVAEAVQTLSANNAGTAPPSWSAFGFATGASAPSLRGFNDAYTITLFDNLRSAYYPLADDGFRNFVDINTIPESIVDRVEVLQDGASATYGADAVAGVINVIVKKEIQGAHGNVSYGVSQKGDSRERRADLTLGYGSLADQGFNVYVNGEYQKNDPLYLHQRGYPYGTYDLSRICGTGSDGSQTCGYNAVRNGIQYNGDYAGFSATTVGYGMPYSNATTLDTALAPTGQFSLLNPTAGCQGLPSVTLTADQQGGGTAPNTVCQQDFGQFDEYQSKITRYGLNLHATVNITPDIQAYAMANWYDTKTFSTGSPESFTGSTTPDGGQRVVLSRILLPAYVCPTPTVVVGNGTNGYPAGYVVSTGCNATNGTLNPNNPFAASGDLARLSEVYNQPTSTGTNANTYRLSGGVSGSFSGFHFNVDATASRVDLDITNHNYIKLSNLLNTIGTGSYNFVDQSLNTAAERQFIAPDNTTSSSSKLAEITGTISHDLFTTSGGNVNLALGADWRYESIENPSANAPNDVDPADRYFGINAVSASGHRSVWALLGSLDVPAFTGFDVKAMGRYDHYSTGAHAFSPKFEVQYSPIHQIKLRGTFSKGFRIPSINESSGNGVPTTGYVNGTVNCDVYVTFCASHAGSSYIGNGYSYGLSSVGNPNLQPEKSQSYTAGVVLQPIRPVTLTVDYWHTKIKNIIIPATSSAAIIDQYYSNNGVVNVPGVTVTPGTPDPDNPTALPLLGFVQSPYVNADSEVGDGIDFSATARLPLTSSGIRLISSINASYLHKLTLTDALNGVQKFAGTLSPCAITSCSGAPKWRGNWQNTVDFGGRASITATVYYTSGYSDISTDSGGIYGDCAGSAANGSLIGVYYDGTPFQCRTKATWDVDLTAQVKVLPWVTIYGNVLNVFNTHAPFDPNAGYGIYNFNPAWADRNFIGRYFRIGARFDTDAPRHVAEAVAPVLPPPPPPAAPATQTCADGTVIEATASCPVPPPPPPPPPAATPERGQ